MHCASGGSGRRLRTRRRRRLHRRLQSSWTAGAGSLGGGGEGNGGEGGGEEGEKEQEARKKATQWGVGELGEQEGLLKSDLAQGFGSDPALRGGSRRELAV